MEEKGRKKGKKRRKEMGEKERKEEKGKGKKARREGKEKGEEKKGKEKEGGEMRQDRLNVEVGHEGVEIKGREGGEGRGG